MKKKTYNKDTYIYRNKNGKGYFNWDEQYDNKRDVNIYDADTFDNNSHLVGRPSDNYIRVNFFEELKRSRKQKLEQLNEN